MIDHGKKCIFIHIPKTGGTSLSRALGIPKDHKHLTLEKLWQMEAHLNLNNDKNKLNQYFKFTFARNPWDRMVSLYLQKKQKGWINEGVNFSDFILHGIDNPSAISKDPNLKDHVRPCSYWMKIDNKMALDFVGRFEHLEEDYRFVCKKLGISPIELPNLLKRLKEHYSTYYNHETMQKVLEYYKEDIERFSYEFKTVSSVNDESG